MDDSRFMAGRNRSGNSAEMQKQRGSIQGSFVQNVGEGFSFEFLHDQKLVAVLFEVVEVADDVGMRKAKAEAGFSFQAALHPPWRIRAERFDGYRTIEGSVESLIDDRHPTLFDLAFEGVSSAPGSYRRRSHTGGGGVGLDAFGVAHVRKFFSSSTSAVSSWNWSVLSHLGKDSSPISFLGALFGFGGENRIRGGFLCRIRRVSGLYFSKSVP